MQYPKLNSLNSSTDYMDLFLGLNHNLRQNDNEFYDMKNLTSDGYPTLSVRPQRGNMFKDNPSFLSNLSKPVGMVDRDVLYIIRKTGNYELTITYKHEQTIKNIQIGGCKDTDDVRQVISMGSYIIIMPDKIYFNTADPQHDFGHIEANMSLSSVLCQPCEYDGTILNVDYVGNEAPETYYDGTIWLDSSDGILKRYDKIYNVWTAITNSYIKITYTPSGQDADISSKFAVGDGLLFSGFNENAINGYHTITRFLSDNSIVIPGELNTVTGKSLWHIFSDTGEYDPLQGLMIETSYSGEIAEDELIGKHLMIGNNNYLISGNTHKAEGNRGLVVYLGITETVQFEKNAGAYIVEEGINRIESGVTLDRSMPDMDFVISSNNRLWGCKYGNGVNQLYSSRLGDFRNWNVYNGNSMDSWYANLGCDGEFTGAIDYFGYPMFFKENNIITVTVAGVNTNHSVLTRAQRGVQKGSARSLCILNDILYYKSINGIMAYSGSSPTLVSEPLGEASFSSAVCGGLNNKLYVNMKSEEDLKYYMYVYDTVKNMWHKEDQIRIRLFCNVHDQIFTYHQNQYILNSNLYYIDQDIFDKIQGSVVQKWDKCYKSIIGTAADADTDKIDWFAETGIIGCDTTLHKYFSKLNIKLDLDCDSYVDVLIQYDSNSQWSLLQHIGDGQERLFQKTFPIKIQRCDHFRLRFEGKGNAKIYAISKTMTPGSDR